MENFAYLLLGGNLGDKQQILIEAKNFLMENKIQILNASHYYKTSAWGLEDQPDFLNQVIKIQTTFNASQLLEITQKTENYLGRKREVKYGARTLDIDILYFNDEIIENENLIIPHPQIQNRKFTLIPLVEISNDFIHPVLKISNQVMLNICKDKGDVEIIE